MVGKVLSCKTEWGDVVSTKIFKNLIAYFEPDSARCRVKKLLKIILSLRNFLATAAGHNLVIWILKN